MSDEINFIHQGRNGTFIIFDGKSVETIQNLKFRELERHILLLPRKSVDWKEQILEEIRDLTYQTEEEARQNIPLHDPKKKYRMGTKVRSRDGKILIKIRGGWDEIL